jgi:hypothetical protein
MPFKSKAQMRYLYANHPAVAKEFSRHTSKAQMKRLPAKKKAPSGKTMRRVQQRIRGSS